VSRRRGKGRPAPSARPPVTVAVRGGAPADVARLRATLGVADTVVALPEGADVSDALAVTDGGDAVVLVDAHAVPGPRWIDRLWAALDADPGLAAVGPATNAAPWPQCGADVPDPDARGGDVAAHARALAAAAPAPFDAPLVDACVMVRASAVGGRTAVVPAAYVHVRAGVPAVSACLIVRDEEAQLGACLAALDGLVDEIVVHDTGSSDATVAIARAAGAVVIEGSWGDDFAAAREVVRRAARGRWVVSVDADEVLEATPAERRAFRELLLTGAGPAGGAAEVCTLPLFDLHGSVLAPVRAEHPVPLARVFRRTRVRWQGALHEQPLTPTGRVPATLALDAPRIVHSGYLREHVAAKDKGARNTRIAAAEAAHHDDRARARFELGRAHLLADRPQEALVELRAALDDTGDVTFRRAAAEYGSQVALRLGRLDEAAELAEQVARLDGPAGLVALLRARVLLARGEGTAALQALAGLGPGSVVNDVYSANDPVEVDLLRAGALVASGRPGEALPLARALVASRPLDGRGWLVLAQAGDAVGEVPTEAVPDLVGDELEAACRVVTGLEPVPAELLLDALYRRLGDVAAVYAYVLPLLPGADVDAAVRWSARLHRIGLAERCPLAAVAADATRSPVDRLLAAAALLAQGGDPAVVGPLAEDAAAALPVAALAPLLAELLDRASAVADHLVLGAATDAERCLELLAPLAAAGQDDQALTVALHGASLAETGPEPFLRCAAARLGAAQAARLRARATAVGVGDLVGALAA